MLKKNRIKHEVIPSHLTYIFPNPTIYHISIHFEKKHSFEKLNNPFSVYDPFLFSNECKCKTILFLFQDVPNPWKKVQEKGKRPSHLISSSRFYFLIKKNLPEPIFTFVFLPCFGRISAVGFSLIATCKLSYGAYFFVLQETQNSVYFRRKINLVCVLLRALGLRK